MKLSLLPQLRSTPSSSLFLLFLLSRILKIASRLLTASILLLPLISWTLADTYEEHTVETKYLVPLPPSPSHLFPSQLINKGRILTITFNEVFDLCYDWTSTCYISEKAACNFNLWSLKQQKPRPLQFSKKRTQNLFTTLTNCNCCCGYYCNDTSHTSCSLKHPLYFSVLHLS